LANILQDIWIIDISGIVLYHRVYNKKIDVQLFGGLMSAIDKVAEMIIETRIKSINFGNKCFGILKKENILFIANSDENIGSRTINYELELIAIKFLKSYRKHLPKEGFVDVSTFNDFTGEIKDSLMNPNKKNASPIHSLGKDLPDFSEWLRKVRSVSNHKTSL